MAISGFSYWIFIFLFSQVTPLIIGSPMQVHGFFYLLTAVNLFAVIFTLLSLPETKVRKCVCFEVNNVLAL